MAFFFAFAMTRSPYHLSPGPEYIHALQNYKQLIDLNASVITFTSMHRMRECLALSACVAPRVSMHPTSAPAWLGAALLPRRYLLAGAAGRGRDRRKPRIVRYRGGKGRHPQMPVRAVALDRSNKWSRLDQVRLSAARQTCTMLIARPLAPWVFQLGSRGNPAHCRTPQVTLEETVHQSRCPGGDAGQSSSCCPFSRAASTRSRRWRRR